MRPLLVVPSLALFLSACGPEKGDDSGESSAASDATSNATSSATTDAPTGGSGDTGGSGGMSEPATTAGPDCSQYADDELGPTVQINILHSGSEPVWLPAASCAGSPVLHALDATNVDYFYRGTSSCAPTGCAEIMTLETCEIVCDPCAPPSLLRVDPGAVIVVTWVAAITEPLELTAECAPGTGCAGPCDRLKRAPEGLYTIELPGFLGCTGDCACDPADPSGFCSLFGVAEGGEPTTFTATVNYSAETTVNLVIP